MGSHLISLNGACEATSLSRTMINRLRAQGSFPAAVPVGEKRIAFVREEVTAWIRERIAARDVVQPTNVASTKEHLANVAPDLLAYAVECAAKLRFYEQQHRAKGTPDADEKAEVNRALAEKGETIIARTTGAA